MSLALDIVNLTPDTAPQIGAILACVQEKPETQLSLDEKVAVKEAFRISEDIDYVFLRRFSDGRSAQVAAYVIDNSEHRLSQVDINHIHHTVWLSGLSPLLYVGSTSQVDIYSCAGAASIDADRQWKPTVIETIQTSSTISQKLKEKRDRFSAYSLANGTFWDDTRNAAIASIDKAAHKALILNVEHADRKLKGDANPAARHLLLLTLLLKYLEDRKVFDEFPQTEGLKSWFSKFHPGAESCLHVFKFGGTHATLNMCKALEEKFNGDIFRISDEHEKAINDSLLRHLVDLVCKNLDSQSGQFYLWDFYSFEHIPVEVLSHIYQYFADREKGAVFTPPLVVNLMLDQVLPLASPCPEEKTILDPSCGSGIFLVSAFRRLVHFWCEKHDWTRPKAKELTELLGRTIFGIELQSQAAELAAFSLALAVCDALRPDIIWNDLRFDKLLNKNIYSGDYCTHIEAAKNNTGGRGFDIIVGNPPFQRKLEEHIDITQIPGSGSIPSTQIAFFFLWHCTDYALKDNGKLCMLQPAGLLYSSRSETFRKKFINEFQIDCVLDFVSIRGLFNKADPKAVAVLATKIEPKSTHAIQHWTFRRTYAADRLIYFDLDFYDYHQVKQHVASKENHWPWRVNLFGGGRLFQLVQRLKEFLTIGDFLEANEWTAILGYVVGNQQTHLPWLRGKAVITPEALPDGADEIHINNLGVVAEEKFQSTGRQVVYEPPMFLIRRLSSLPCAYWERSPLAYTLEFIGITSNDKTDFRIKNFAESFIENRKYLSAFLCLTDSRSLITRATSVNKGDILSLPWPQDGKWNLSIWEKEMLNDVLEYMYDFVRLGQESEILQSSADEGSLSEYCETFLRLIKRIYPQSGIAGYANKYGLIYQAFYLGGELPKWFESDDWAEKADSIVFSHSAPSSNLRNIRIIRLYHKNLIIFIKPNLLRYWIRSTAIRDVDETLYDIVHGE